MSTLADDIKALMVLGHGLETATQLAVTDRNRTGNSMKFYCIFLVFILILCHHVRNWNNGKVG
jgi:hypothetical protein